MRWMQTVGVVRWCRFRPELKENLSGGVGFVRWCRNGSWDEAWDFLVDEVVRADSHWRADVNKLRSQGEVVESMTSIIYDCGP